MNRKAERNARFILQGLLFFLVLFSLIAHIVRVMKIELREKTELLFRRKYTVNEKTGCHEWQAGLTRAGYGQFRVDGKVMKSHRVSWLLHHGEIADGMFVCHHCDNPKCVNPDHLFLGSHDDNMADMRSKGRGVVPSGEWRAIRPESVLRGENAPSAKLPQSVVQSILADPDTSWGCRKRIAAKHGIAPQHVGRILAGKAWSHCQ